MLAKREIERLFKLLNDELAKTNQTGEVYLVGGAVMCLVYDVRFLLRLLDITRYEDALAVIARYYPLNRFPQKTLYALEEMITP